jgi:hypothetical protein
VAQRCGVCAHVRRAQVDQELRGDPNISEIGRELGVTRFAVQRHRDHHLTRAVSAQPKGLEQASSVRTLDEETEAPPPLPRNAPTDPQTAFLTSYAANGDLKAGLKAAGITRPQLRKWQEHDVDFGLRFYQAEIEAIEALEAEARTRAVAGSRLVRRVFRHGLLYEEIHEFRPSDAMLIKLLQAHKPERYGDKLTLTQTQVIKAVDAQAWESV